MLYPEIEAYQKMSLDVGDGHCLNVELYGNKRGTPVVFLHGGPGGGIEKSYARYFDPQKWNIILFDQRGCGKSTPFASLTNNTTWDLVGDIEKIRSHLGFERWMVFGGSWGSTLALSYGITHPESCLGFVLRGIFLGRGQDADWLFQEGAGRFFPKEWEAFKSLIPDQDQDRMIDSYYALLTSDDEAVRLQAASNWARWENSVSRLIQNEEAIATADDAHFALPFARIEAHYFVNKCFFEYDDFLLDNVSKIAHLPCYIVHGRYDVVCDPRQAWLLKERLPKAELVYADAAGHSLAEENIEKEIIKFTDEFPV